jgi:hypothetical protein
LAYGQGFKVLQDVCDVSKEKGQGQGVKACIYSFVIEQWRRVEASECLVFGCCHKWNMNAEEDNCYPSCQFPCAYDYVVFN